MIGKPSCEEGIILGGALTVPCSVSSRRWTLAAAILGSSLAFIDGTVVNVALPAIQHAFGSTTSEAQWVMESYALFLASLLLVGGVLGDRFGRKRIFILGAVVFILASIACSLSITIGALIAARAIQGIGAALLVPGSLALISATYPASERGAAIGTWSGFTGITAAVGPVIGGFLVDHYAWTWAFLVNVPLGLLLLAIGIVKVPESKAIQTGGQIDYLGAALVTIGLAGVVYAFIEAPGRGWGALSVYGSLAAGIASMLLFIRVEARAISPMLPLPLFRDRGFTGANLLTLMLYAALGGTLFFLPLNLIQVQGYSATGAGAALLPFIAIMFILSRWAGGLVNRFGARLPLVLGPLVAAAGFALFAPISVGAYYWTTFFPAICVLGLGMSITVAPLTTTVMNAAGNEWAGTASGINNAISRAAALLAIALFGFAMNMAFNARMDVELRNLALSADVMSTMLAQRQKLAGIIIPSNQAEATVTALRHAVDASFVSGFRLVMLISAALSLLSAGAAWLFIPGKAGNSLPE